MTDSYILQKVGNLKLTPATIGSLSYIVVYQKLMISVRLQTDTVTNTLTSYLMLP